MKPIPENPTVAILGGAGEMGRTAVAIVSQFEQIGELIVADANEEEAKGVISRNLKSSKTRMRAQFVDVTDSQELHSFLSDVAIVLNTVGPFYKYGVDVLSAAIASGCHYIDICDDWEPTIEMMGLDQDARLNDVLAIIGMGASPGISNLLACLVCEELETVEDLFTVWPVDAGERGDAIEKAVKKNKGTSGAIIHWMQQISGEIDLIENGKQVSRPPMQAIELQYPGLGSGSGYTVGHPEPLTLAKSMGISGNSANLMLMQSATAAFISNLGKEINRGKTSIEDAALQVGSPSTIRKLKAALSQFRYPKANNLPPFFAWGKGTIDKEQFLVAARITSSPPAMDSATSWPLAIALQQILENQIHAVGVHAPETIINQDHFFNAFAKCSEPPMSGADDIVEIVKEKL